MTTPTETPLVFEVDGSPVLGILHAPRQLARVGMIMIAAGGPQYHVGCCRQLLTWARCFADNGIAVLRFDYRGMGDSGGEYRGFEFIDDDLRAAVDQLLSAQPQLQSVILWGGCSAASAILMYAWQDPRVGGFIISNPWLMEPQNQARNLLKHHYAKRLADPAFWRSVFSGGVAIGPAVKGLLETLVTRLRPARATVPEIDPEQTPQGSGHGSPVVQRPFIERMLQGLQSFQGKGLILGSAGVVGQEFDELLRASRPWGKAAKRSNYRRLILEQAGHNFAEKTASREVTESALAWLDEQFGPGR